MFAWTICFAALSPLCFYAHPVRPPKGHTKLRLITTARNQSGRAYELGRLTNCYAHFYAQYLEHTYSHDHEYHA